MLLHPYWISVHWVGRFPPFLQKNGHRCMLLSPCRGFISGRVGSFQAEQAFAGQRALTIGSLLCVSEVRVLREREINPREKNPGSSSDRVRISWNSAEVASRPCCLCSLSSAPLPGVQVGGKSVRLVFRKSWV